MSCRPPRSTQPPFGTWDNLPAANQTTYGTAFMKYDIVPRTAIRPKEQHPWKTVAKFDTRSTAQDAYLNMGASSVRESFKPLREYESVPWPQKLTTTNQAMFLGNHGIHFHFSRRTHEFSFFLLSISAFPFSLWKLYRFKSSEIIPNIYASCTRH